jgi:YidC/Oxa1 family membrane protein insertase
LKSVNRNTLFAIVLIMATVAFFSGSTWNKFYYGKILHEPLPATYVSKAQGSGNQVSPGAGVPSLPQNVTLEEKPALPARAAVVAPPAAKIDTIWVETDKIIAGISELGARIVSLKMKEYNISHLSRARDAEGYVDLIEKNSQGGAGLTINNQCFDNELFAPEAALPSNRMTVEAGGRTDLTLIAHDPVSGAEVKKKFTFSADDYKIGFEVSGTQINNSKVMVSWPSGIAESELLSSGRSSQTEERVAHYFDGNEVEHIKSAKAEKEDFSGFFRWVGVSSKYFFEAIVADTVRDADIKIISMPDTTIALQNGKKNNTKWTNYAFSYQFTTQGNTASFWFYTGPSRYTDLKKYGLQFQKIMFPVLGWTRWFFWADKWFPPIAEFILWVLLILFKVTKDYGVSILLLTLLSRIITYPLTQSSMKSMNRMKDLQPKINAIRAKYKSNPQKMNEATMALYKAEGVNPLNPGCLPMFLQMPIFIALFVVLRKAIELRGAGTVLVPWVHDLSQPESVFYLGNILPGGIPMYGSNVAIIPIIMAILTYFQNKMTIKDPNQKMMIYFMPIFMLVLFNNFASGLVLYWTLSSALGLLQQYLMNKSTRAPAAVVVQGSGATPPRSERPSTRRK